MRELYENDAAGFGDDADEAVNLKKPTWDDDIDITDIVPHGLDLEDEDTAGPSDKKKKKKKKKKGADEDAIDADGVDVDEMDADVERPLAAFDDEEEWDGTEEMRKRKLEEYMDEVYGLDFNDVVRLCSPSVVFHPPMLTARVASLGRRYANALPLY